MVSAEGRGGEMEGAREGRREGEWTLLPVWEEEERLKAGKNESAGRGGRRGKAGKKLDH